MKGAFDTAAKVSVAMFAAAFVFYLFWSPVPADHTAYFEDQTPGDLDTIRETGADLERRLGPNDQLFSIRANYYAGTNINHTWTSRRWIVVNKYNVGNFDTDSPRYQQTRNGLVRKMQSGTIQIIVMTPRMEATIRNWNVTEQAFHANYCRVQPRPQVYERLDTHIYKHRPNATNCNSTITVEWRADLAG